MTKVLGLLALVAIIATQSGCGILFGNVKPVDEKSDYYGIADLSRENTDWIKLDAGKIAKQDADSTPTEIGDVAYQSQKTAATISINSACREGRNVADQTLHAITDESLLGISNVTLREEKNYTQQGLPALETTILGKMNGEEVMLRTVV